MADLSKFNEKLNKKIVVKKPWSFLITESEYGKLVQDLNRIGVTGCKEKSDYSKRKRFGLKSIGETTKLVKNGTDLIYLSTSELFDQIHASHIQLAHGRRNVLLNELSKRFANVTRDLVMDYLGLCEECQKKKSKTSKRIVVKPIISNDLNSRCQMDLIDMQRQPDGDYRFILMYQDYLTKFVQLRALKMKTAEEVANVLVDIFSIFGAPHILHTDNCREFKNKLISEVLLLWPGCKQVHGNPRHSQAQGSMEMANRDVEDKLKCWMADNATTKWSVGLRFVQFATNRCLHADIGRSPYKAMFGVDPKVGLSTTVLPGSVIEEIDDEEDLERVLNGIIDGQEDDRETDRQKGEGQDDDNQEIDFQENDQEIGFQENDCQETDFQENDVQESDGREKRNHESCIVCDKSCQDAVVCLFCQLPCHIACGVADIGSRVICWLCKRGESSKDERRGAKRSMTVQVEEMKQASDKRLKLAEIGQSVLVPIPDSDRVGVDQRNLIGVVMEDNDGFYKIGTKHGVLKGLYTRGQFDLCGDKVLSASEVPEEEISIREASMYVRFAW